MKKHFCCWCGTELEGSTVYNDKYDTCGAPECERNSRQGQEQEREEAHQRLDDQFGY